MEKEIILFDYTKQSHRFIIKNFQNAVAILILIVSGDEIANVLYKNGANVIFDSNEQENRTIDFLDTMYFLPLKDIDDFNLSFKEEREERWVR